MIFIDTGAFIARYLKTDQYHFKAAGAWKALSDDRTPLVTSSLVLTETINFFSRRSVRFAVEIAEVLYTSGTLEILRPGAEDEFEAIRFLKKYADQAISFTDCISFALMKSRRIYRAFSFDRHFDLPGFTRFPL